MEAKLCFKTSEISNEKQSAIQEFFKDCSICNRIGARVREVIFKDSHTGCAYIDFDRELTSKLSQSDVSGIVLSSLVTKDRSSFSFINVVFNIKVEER
mgnify:CR=1 FL=1|jgi:hypothetical protein